MAYTYRYIETNAISYEGDSVFHLLGVIDIFIAITTYKHLTEADLQHFIEISKGIDGLLFRTPMSSDDLFSFLEKLIVVSLKTKLLSIAMLTY